MSTNELRTQLHQAQRIVVKVGSALLAQNGAGDGLTKTNGSGLALDKIARYSDELAQLQAAGKQVVLVSSGAVAAGCARLGWSQRPTTVHELQAAAAVGQMGLAQAYESALAQYGCGTAMVMLTHDDLANRERYLNARATLGQLLKLGIVPVINENDTVATDEIRFGDNDTLAALVVNLLQADLFIILTDVDGLMDADPRQSQSAERIVSAAADDAALDRLPGQGAGRLGRGGMVSKLRAARLAARSGAHTLIANGQRDHVLHDLMHGADLGTLLYAELTPLTARKRWIADQLRAKGDLQLDDGAANALKRNGVSLLAVGVTGVRGQFYRGDVVRCIDRHGQVVAQGLSNYASADIARLVGVQSEDFAQHVDYVAEPELIHRDNLVVVAAGLDD